MKVLLITGDKTFNSGHERYELQKSAVDALEVIYWGRGALWPKIPKGPFDVVTSQDPFWRGLFGWWAARRVGAKLNIQVHADLSGQPLIKHILAQIVLRHANSVRAVSEKIKEQVAHTAARVPVVVLPVFVDIEKFKKVVPESHEGKTILWIGRFEQEKDPLRALEIFSQVCTAVPEVKLIMLGQGSLGQALRDASAGLAEIIFPGWQDPLPYLQKADAVVCTSRFESWGASMVEALAAGVPVVAPDVGVAREAGAHVVPREKLAEAVVDILRSGKRGVLKLQLPTREAWQKCWRESLDPGRVEA